MVARLLECGGFYFYFLKGKILDSRCDFDECEVSSRLFPRSFVVRQLGRTKRTVMGAQVPHEINQNPLGQ